MGAALGWILRGLAVLLLVRLVLRALRNAGRVQEPPRPRKVERAGGALARDPQCGTYVPRASAVTARHAGATVYFCSAACRDTYLSAEKKAG